MMNFIKLMFGTWAVIKKFSAPLKVTRRRAGIVIDQSEEGFIITIEEHTMTGERRAYAKNMSGKIYTIDADWAMVLSKNSDEISWIKEN